MFRLIPSWCQKCHSFVPISLLAGPASTSGGPRPAARGDPHRDVAVLTTAARAAAVSARLRPAWTRMSARIPVPAGDR